MCILIIWVPLTHPQQPYFCNKIEGNDPSRFCYINYQQALTVSLTFHSGDEAIDLKLKRYLCRCSKCPAAKLNPIARRKLAFRQEQSITQFGQITTFTNLLFTAVLRDVRQRICGLLQKTQPIPVIAGVVIRTGESMTERCFSVVFPLLMPRQPNNGARIKSCEFISSKPMDFYSAFPLCKFHPDVADTVLTVVLACLCYWVGKVQSEFCCPICHRLLLKL